MQVKITQHAQLERSVASPFGLCLCNGNGVYEVYHNFHSQKYNNEADCVQHSTLHGDTREGIAKLGDVIIESQDRSCKIKWCIKNVCDVIPERKVLVLGRYVDSISLRQV